MLSDNAFCNFMPYGILVDVIMENLTLCDLA